MRALRTAEARRRMHRVSRPVVLREGEPSTQSLIAARRLLNIFVNEKLEAACMSKRQTAYARTVIHSDEHVRAVMSSLALDFEDCVNGDDFDGYVIEVLSTVRLWEIIEHAVDRAKNLPRIT